MKHALLAAPLAVLAFALPSSAPPAAADAYDDAFIHTLETLGFQDIDPVGDIHNAVWICDHVWAGMSPWQATAELDRVQENLDYEHSKLFAQAAISTYCPPEPDEPLVQR